MARNTNLNSSPPPTATLESGQILFSLHETAGLLGVSMTTLNDMILNTGRLKRISIGRCVRVHRDDLVKYINELVAEAV